MSKKFELAPEAFRFEGKMSLKEAIPLGMQHVLAMFVGPGAATADAGPGRCL